VPLRVVMDGSRASSSGDELLFHHVYDFNLVAPLGVVEDNFFSVSYSISLVYCLKDSRLFEISIPLRTLFYLPPR